MKLGGACHAGAPWLVSVSMRWISGRSVATTLLALLIGFELVSPASAQPVSGRTLTPERLAAVAAVLAGLISVALGGWALRSAAHRRADFGGSASAAALGSGLVGTALGALVIAKAEGGFGSGQGLAGGLVAIAVGLLGIAVNWRARARSRRSR